MSLELRYGTWLLCWSSALITLPSASSDELMFWASVSVSPDAPVLFTRSLPARSHSVSLPWVRTPVDRLVPCRRQAWGSGEWSGHAPPASIGDPPPPPQGRMEQQHRAAQHGTHSSGRTSLSGWKFGN